MIKQHFNIKIFLFCHGTIRKLAGEANNSSGYKKKKKKEIMRSKIALQSKETETFKYHY